MVSDHQWNPDLCNEKDCITKADVLMKVYVILKLDLLDMLMTN